MVPAARAPAAGAERQHNRVARRDGCDIGAHRDDLAGTFVTENRGQRDLVETAFLRHDIGMANADAFYPHKYFVGERILEHGGFDGERLPVSPAYGGADLVH
jgi:hypothetical protein